MAIVFGLACRSSLLAAQAKSAKSLSTNPVVKTDPNEWQKVLEAARKEGKIVMSGPPGDGWRKSLVDMFQQEYPEITVEFTAVPGRNFLQRIRQEREFGKKLWDLYAGGPNTAIDVKKEGFLAPIRSLLLPEVADDNKWIGGIDGTFIDREKKYIQAYILNISLSAHANRDFIKESDLKSSEQLLDPQFRGKISIVTPTGAGASQGSICHLGFMYGENFIRELLSKQNVVVTDDNRQQAEWLVRGKYPIAIGVAYGSLITFQEQGLGKNIKILEDKIIRTLSASGSISLLEGGPHPNAAKVYINWLLSQKTQMKLTQNLQLYNSRRTDVPVVNKELAVDPAKLSKYRYTDTEEMQAFNLRYDPIIKEALKK